MKNKYIEVWGTSMLGTFVAGKFKVFNRIQAIKKAIQKHGPDYTYYTVGNKKDYYIYGGNLKIEKRNHEN